MDSAQRRTAPLFEQPENQPAPPPAKKPRRSQARKLRIERIMTDLLIGSLDGIPPPLGFNDWALSCAYDTAVQIVDYVDSKEK